jgi:hypothetical protein
MKTNRIKSLIINLITANNMRKVLIVISLLITSTLIFAQPGGGANPGGDPTGFPTPIDGGILMALLAGGGLVAMLFKKKKDKE